MEGIDVGCMALGESTVLLCIEHNIYASPLDIHHLTIGKNERGQGIPIL